jgi:hypothetical protein
MPTFGAFWSTRTEPRRSTLLPHSCLFSALMLDTESVHVHPLAGQNSSSTNEDSALGPGVVESRGVQMIGRPAPGYLHGLCLALQHDESEKLSMTNRRTLRCRRRPPDGLVPTCVVRRRWRASLGFVRLAAHLTGSPQYHGRRYVCQT